MRDFLLTLYSYAILYISHLIHVPDNDMLPIDLERDNVHFAGLVLARGGSKGIKLKNLSKINNTTLLTRALNTMQKFGRFDSIWVSTDHEKIAEESQKSPNVSVHFRAAYTATDRAPSLTAVQEFLGHHPEINIVALIQCTSPFLKAEYLSKAFDAMMSGYHSVFSITRQFKLRWKLTQGFVPVADVDSRPLKEDRNSFLRISLVTPHCLVPLNAERNERHTCVPISNQNNKLVPDNFNVQTRPRRQDWTGEMVENGMFYMTYSSLVLDFNVLQGGRVAVVDIPPSESLEIDTMDDLILAELLEMRRS